MGMKRGVRVFGCRERSEWKGRREPRSPFPSRECLVGLIRHDPRTMGRKGGKTATATSSIIIFQPSTLPFQLSS